MTVFDARAQRLLNEIEERAYWISASISALRESVIRMTADHAAPSGIRAAQNVIADLRKQRNALGAKECDVCGQWRNGVEKIWAFGIETYACEVCRGG